MAFEHWYCEHCHVENTVQYKRDATVHEVRDAINAQHRRIAPKCHDENSLDHIRVGFPDQGISLGDEDETPS